MANCLFNWQQDNKHIKRVFMLFVTALSYQQWDLCSSTSVSHSSPFLWVSYVCSQAWQGQRCRNLTNFQIRLSPCLLNRGRKRILSQNKRWRADPFPCAVKQYLHSELSKWHLIWFCCWSLRYPECFQDIYPGCRATLACYEGGEIWWAVTPHHAHKWRHTHLRTHTLPNGGKHPEIKPQVAGLISQDTTGHVRQKWKDKLG